MEKSNQTGKLFKLPEISSQILENIFNEQITDESYLLLHSIFGDIFVNALEIVDKSKITLYETPDGCRRFIQIDRGPTQIYYCFEDINYCHCPFFKMKVLYSHKKLTCKHVLAAKIAMHLNKFSKEILSNDQISELIKCIQMA